MEAGRLAGMLMPNAREAADDTANVGHLSQFVPAALWTDIVP